MIKKFDEKNIYNLAKAFCMIDNEEDCLRFLADLCTVSELKAMEQRIEVALLLSDGMIYNDILERTGASSATISRVNRSLSGGSGGYESYFAKHGAEDENK